MKKVKIAALLAALITGILLYFFLSSLGQADEEDNLQVAAALVDIPANTLITSEMITIAEIPKTAVLNGAIYDEKNVLGKVSKMFIMAGEQIISNKLVSAGDSNSETLAYAIEPNMRAITIAVDQVTGIAGMLKPQDKIDIISDFEKSMPDGTTQTYTTIIAEEITVLSVDSTLAQEGKTIPGDEDDNTYSTITLQVTPKQALEISLSEYKGHLRAVLRSPLDRTKTNLPGITLDSIIVN